MKFTSRVNPAVLNLADSQSRLRPLFALFLATALTLLAVDRVRADTASDNDMAVQLINDMANALEKLTYRGTFVHIYAGQVESMKIQHSHDGIGINERMTSLNGEAREVYRNKSLVTCIWPGSQSIIQSKSKPRELIPKVDRSLTDSGFYTFELLEEDRVAGLDAYVVSVVPSDQYRYGYRFWIEKETKMLLRSVLKGNGGASIEELMFTDIEFPESIPDEDLMADTHKKGGEWSWIEPTDRPAQNLPGEERVKFTSMPGGYNKVSETYRPMPMNDHPVSHVLISDGMASISVYVEYTDSPGTESGATSMGAMNAYGRTLPNAMITVVGEVPAETVKYIGDAVTLASTQ